MPLCRSPLTLRLRYSRVRGRRQSKFLASSSTGGARNFYPSIRSEAPSFIVARAEKPLVFGAKHQTQNVVRQSRTNILPKIHRGAENALSLPRCKPRLSPPPAGCPHPSRCGAAPHRATFPKGKAQAVEKVLRRIPFSPSVFCPHGAKKAAPSDEGAKECA